MYSERRHHLRQTSGSPTILVNAPGRFAPFLGNTKEGWLENGKEVE